MVSGKYFIFIFSYCDFPGKIRATDRKLGGVDLLQEAFLACLP